MVRRQIHNKTHLFQAPGKAERIDALEDVKQACGVIEHSNVNHIR